MSLVAVFTNYGFPLMVSDVLVSGDEDEEMIPLPSINRIPHEEDFKLTSLSPVAFIQNVYIITPRLIVGMVGKIHQMEKLIREIRLRFSYVEPTETSIHEFKDDVDWSDFDSSQSSIFFLLITQVTPKPTFVLSVRGPHLRLKDPSISECFAIGSGSNSLIKALQDTLPYLPGIKINDARYKAAMVCLKLLAEERAGPGNLQDGWGGAFEIVYFDGEIFRKQESVNYTFFQAVEVESKINVTPKMFVNTTYLGENFMINVYNGKFGAYVVLPLDSIESVNVCFESIISKFDSNLNCCHIDMSTVSQSNGSIIFLDTGLLNNGQERARPPIFLKDHEGSWTFHVEQSLIDILCRLVQESK